MEEMNTIFLISKYNIRSQKNWLIYLKLQECLDLNGSISKIQSKKYNFIFTYN